MCEAVSRRGSYFKEGGLAGKVFCAIVALLCATYEVRGCLMHFFLKGEMDGFSSEEEGGSSLYL